MIKCSVCGESLNGQTKCPVCGTVNYNVGQDKPKIKETNNNVGYVDPVQAKLDVIENFKKSVAKVNVEILGHGYAHGTGWCGYDNTIITNAHVVLPSEPDHIINSIICEFSSDLKLKKNMYAMEIVYVSPIEDIAILKPIKGELPKEINVLKISDEEPRTGEEVFTIGNPLHYNFTCMNGIVSNAHYKRNYGRSIYEVLQTTLTLNGGNSGGAVFNVKGEVIGMATFSELREDVSRVGVALPEGLVPLDVVQKLEINGYGFCVKSEAILVALEIAKKKMKK